MSSRRVALVTGANASIGFEVVRALAQRGMTVYLGSRDPAEGERAAAELADEGDVRSIHVELTDDASLVAAVERIRQAEGVLDVLVNNAGVLPDAASASEADPAVVRQAMEINVHGAARLIQLALPLLRRSDGARVVNVSGGLASLSWLSEDSDALAVKPYAYCLSKIAMNGMTLLFADELRRDNIKVNACTPGYVKSKMTRFKGRKTPEEGARIIVKLATLTNSGPTGGFFNEDGALRW